MPGAGPEHERPIPKMHCPAAAPHAQMREKASLKRRLSYLLKGPSGYIVRCSVVLIINHDQRESSSERLFIYLTFFCIGAMSKNREKNKLRGKKAEILIS